MTVEWVRSTYSLGNGDCVEAGAGACGMVHVRDSKDRAGLVLDFTPADWAAFLAGVKASEFDHLAPP